MERQQTVLNTKEPGTSTTNPHNQPILDSREVTPQPNVKCEDLTPIPAQATKLPPILPIVLYQGGDAWTCDVSLSSLIDIPAGLAAFQPDFRHLLIDLNQIQSENIQRAPNLQTILLALKTSRKHTNKDLELLIGLLAAIIHNDPPLIRSVMLYLYSVDNQTDINDYINKAAALNQPDLQEEIMTIADTLRKEGKLEGKQEALRGDILDILELRFQSVSYSIKKQLEEVTDAIVLRRFLHLAVKTESIEQFMKEMGHSPRERLETGIRR